MKMVITGAGGQLGRCLMALADAGGLPSGWVPIGLDRHRLDITDADAVDACFRQLRPDVVVNAAAWTDVDGAQADEAKAMAVNALGAANVAAAAALCGARLVHLSTDYVFDGRDRQPIDEAARPCAVNVYGASKLAGETAVQREAPDAIVLRTSWLYSVHGHNFVKAILRAGRRGDLTVVDDQIGCPTHADDLARAIVQLARHSGLPGGIYHFCGRDAMSWYGFARLVVGTAARIDTFWTRVRVHGAATVFNAAKAPRPAWSVLSCRKVLTLGIKQGCPRDHLDSLVASLLRDGVTDP